jgi:hypothetical protein
VRLLIFSIGKQTCFEHHSHLSADVLLKPGGNIVNRIASFLLVFFMTLSAFGKPGSSGAIIHVSTEAEASDDNPGTGELPIRSVSKALSLARPGDIILFSAGTYECEEEKMPDGVPGSPVTLRSEGNGTVIFKGSGMKNLLHAGSYSSISGIQFVMTGERLEGFGIYINHKQNVEVLNCRFFACQIGVKIISSGHIRIQNCEMAYCGTYGVHMEGSGGGEKGHRDPSDECSWIDVRNCWMHDAGWNIEGTEGYGITSNGAVEYLVIENCQFDNNSGDGILYEDWGIHTTARYNVIRGSGIAGIWIDNASMSIFDNNFLYANNVAIWLSGEESSNRLRSDMISIRNNIIVHNNWAAIDPSVYGRITILFSQNTRDLYFDNNTVAYNHCNRMIGFLRRPPLTEFSNIWFRNNIFWGNTGGVGIDSGLDTAGIHFVNNLWDKPFSLDKHARRGDPSFVDPDASTPDGYMIKDGSPAKDAGIILTENQVDFRNGRRPHLKGSGKYDLGAYESGTSGKAQIGLDISTFPFKVPPFKLQFKAKPDMKSE